MAKPKIIVVGGGFAGLAVAKALGKTPAKVDLIDRTNHHVFQPLLYQVATSVLTSSQIATPIRGVLRNHTNTTVILGEVTGVDKNQKCVFFSDADRQNVPIAYDYLVLATGASHSYFGHNQFAEYAPGLKSLADAEAARNKILQAFELAEAEEDPARHQDLLTFVLVGAGPTGVELAAAIAIWCEARSNPSFAASIRPQPESCWSRWRTESWVPSRSPCRPRRRNGSKIGRGGAVGTQRRSD